MRKSRLISLFLCMVLSGPVYAQDRATYSLLNKPVESAVQDNETVVEFFSFYCPPVMPFHRITVSTKLSGKAFHRGKKWSSIIPVSWGSWVRS